MPARLARDRSLRRLQPQWLGALGEGRAQHRWMHMQQQLAQRRSQANKAPHLVLMNPTTYAGGAYRRPMRALRREFVGDPWWEEPASPPEPPPLEPPQDDTEHLLRWELFHWAAEEMQAHSREACMGIVEEAMEVTRLVVEEALCGGSLTERSVMMVARASRLVPKEVLDAVEEEWKGPLQSR